MTDWKYERRSCLPIGFNIAVFRNIFKDNSAFIKVTVKDVYYSPLALN